MKKYLSLLRGINVSGQKLVKMDVLRELYVRLGFTDVKSYLQSGNIAFSTPQSDTGEMERKIASEIMSTFGFSVFIIVLSREDLDRVFRDMPFPEEVLQNDSSVYITYLNAEPNLLNKDFIVNKKQHSEEITFGSRVVYLYCPNGYGRTKLTNSFLEKKLNVVATTRNWKTTKELLKMIS